MEKRFGSNNIYMLSRAWQWAQIVEYFMEPLGNRIFDRDFDPGRRHFEQINMAARSVSANIAEGLSRCQTSSHTEMTLLDVASGSLSEISSDLMRNSFRNNVWFWNLNDPNDKKVRQLQIMETRFNDNWPKECQLHIWRHIELFRPWFCHQDLTIAYNTMNITVERLKQMVRALNNTRYESFKENGGFSEQLSQERIEARTKSCRV